MAERIDHKDFRSYEYGRGRNRKYTIRYFSRPERRYRRAAERYEDYSAGGSMLVKMGICLLLCGLALVAKTVYKGEDLAQTAASLTEKAEYRRRIPRQAAFCRVAWYNAGIFP